MSRALSAKQKRANTRMVPEEDPEFQIAPMIDILLVLLVFFMSISSTEVLQVRQEIRLPVAKDAAEKEHGKTQNGQIIINVLWNEINRISSIDLDGTNYKVADDIAEKLKSKVSAQPEVRLLVRADRDVRYDFLRTILVVAGNAGIQNVTFSVTDKESRPNPATPN